MSNYSSIWRYSSLCTVALQYSILRLHYSIPLQRAGSLVNHPLLCRSQAFVIVTSITVIHLMHTYLCIFFPLHLLDMFLEVELLGQRVNEYAILLGILKFSSKGECAFLYSHLQCMRVTASPQFCQKYVIKLWKTQQVLKFNCLIIVLWKKSETFDLTCL